MAFKLMLTSLASVVLLGCTTPAPPAATGGPQPAASSEGACNPQGAQFAVGKTAAASLVEQARQRSGSYMARVLRPNQVVTMEFNAQRLNLDVNTAGVITRVRCG